MANLIVEGHRFCFIWVTIVFLIMHFLHSKERKDLYNRIMSRDITDYKSNTDKKAKIIVKKEKVLL